MSIDTPSGTQNPAVITITEKPWDDAPANYKSTDAEVLGKWDDTQRRYREWHAAKDAWGEQFPNHDVTALQQSERVWVVGLRGDESPGSAWRKAVRANIAVWVPDKRTKAGKALAKEIDALAVTHMKDVPGMPDMAMVENRWCTPGLFVHEGVAYVHWSCSFAVVEADPSRGWSKTEFDPSKWERIMRSELYAAQEADQAEKRATSQSAGHGANDDDGTRALRPDSTTP